MEPVLDRFGSPRPLPLLPSLPSSCRWLSILASAMMQRMSAGLTLSNLNFSAFVTLFTSHGEAQAAILTSLELATVTALVTVMIGILTAFFIVRWRTALSGPLDFLMTLPNAIPAMTVAVGLILVWNQAFWPWTPYNTWWVMLLAYTCIMLPYPGADDFRARFGNCRCRCRMRPSSTARPISA